MLRMKMEENKEMYDFKYIKRKFAQPEQEKPYYTPDEINKMIRQPQI